MKTNRPPSVVHQSHDPQLALSQMAGGQHWAAVLRRLSCLSSSLLVGAGEGELLARPGKRASVAVARETDGVYPYPFHTWTLPRATAPQPEK